MSQYLILDAIRGPLEGQSFSIPLGSSLTIGRLPECGIPITQDPTVSRQQCRIEFPGPDAQLVHLSVTSDTLVNRSPATRTELRGGDTIELGTGNLFKVRMDDSAAPPSPRPAASPMKPAGGGHYTMTAASCGWSLYQFPGGIQTPQQLLDLLGKSATVRAIVDFRKTGVQPTEIDPAWAPLFSWLSVDQQLQFSPMIVKSSGVSAELLQSAWGKDALVSVGSTLDDAEFMEHWQAISGVENGQPGKALSIFHWPSLLRLVLTCQQPDRMNPVLSKLSWIAVEDSEAPAQLSLFAPSTFSDELGKRGFSPSSTSATVVSPGKD
ncbi:FHA domain protein [Caulifigura coniformis]|uniref:FHA domain protein n=1 Tax=Caulifigura coniformis TaxID=2527983 RepID=A0A517SI56_9PLAN|nr:FHA domain-containing protein [Caulifigura coniformis]QDT55797.1 FHA domain protein [Caulifigura coniformis]